MPWLISACLIVSTHTPQLWMLRFSGTGLISLPHSNCHTVGDRPFSLAAPTVGNSPPLELRNASSKSFEILPETYLFNKTYGLQPKVIVIIIIMISCVLLFLLKASLGFLVN